MTKYTLEQFKEDVIQWSTDRLIIQNGSITGQLQKVREECAEVTAEIVKFEDNRGNLDLLKKEVGDIAVLLVNIDCMQGSWSDYDFYCEPDKPIDYFMAKKMLANIFKETAYTMDNYTHSWTLLLCVCGYLNLDISECAYLAFKKIEHRKGYFCKESMSFIKEVE
jgi:hypothetical protein